MTIVLQRFDDVETSENRGGFGALASPHGNLPLKQLAYRSSVVALAVRTTILQTYYNPFDQPIEANYVFPIEGQTAVVGCEMRIGDRVVHAQLKERGQARADYDRAIRTGHRAALLEENRPETFSMRVGNIPPGEAVQVCIETVTQLAIVHGEWTLRLPLVVAPRYTSGLPLPRSSVGGGTSHDTDQVPDASTVTPPTWLPGFASPVDLRLSVDLQMGELAGSQSWIENLKSSLHSVVLNASSSGCRIDILLGERVDRDFILRGRVDDSSIRTSLTAETQSSKEDKSGTSKRRLTFAINIVPPRVNQPAPRDVVFLLDRSGSMGGWKITAARRGISRLVDSLLPADRFQVIAFDDKLDAFSTNGKSLAPSWQMAIDANRYEATRWLSKIESRGGTEMGLAIERGLKAYAGDDSARPAGRSLAMVLVTDGQITGEDSILRLLGSIPEQRRPRLYCLGIDRAVNASVLQRIAAFTGGSFELVESEKRLDEVLKHFAEVIGSPAITKLKVDSPTSKTIQLAPAKLDTLYSGRSLAVYGQTEMADSLSLTISGALPNGQAWSQRVSAKVSENRKSILLPLWGKSRVRELEDELVARGTRDQVLKNEIIDCSLACGVLSRLTAFVAVDETEIVSQEQKPHSIMQPSELPEGWGSRIPALDRSSLIALPGSVTQASISSRTLQESSMHVAEHLLKRGKISQEQLSDAQSLAVQQGCTTLDALLRLSYAQDEEIALAAAEASGASYLDARSLHIDDRVIAMLPESLARENCAIPIASSGNTLTILVSDPFNFETVEKLRFVLDRNIVALVGSASAINEAINRHYGTVEGETADSILQEFTDSQIDFTETADDVYGDAFGQGQTYADCWFSDNSPGTLCDYAADEDEDDEEDLRSSGFAFRMPKNRSLSPAPEEIPAAPVVRLVTLMIQEAVKLRASHILIVPEEDIEAGGFTVNYIIDGKLVERDSPKRILNQVITHVKILAKLDIANRESLQSGKIQMTIDQREVELVVHIAGKNLLLEITPEAFLSEMPAAVEEWWQLYKV